MGLTPMRSINQMFGPMTPTTQSGQPNPTMSQGHLPTTGESIWDTILKYGPMPAQLATAMAMQPVTAGQAVGEALHDPSLGRITNAGVQSALALMAPMKALGVMASGYGAAATMDSVGRAYATDRGEVERQLRSMSPTDVRAMQQRLGIAADGRVGAQTVDAVFADEQKEECRG